MIIVKNRGYKRRYVYGGSGIFDSIAGFFSKLFSKAASNAVVRQAASTVLDAGKSVAKEVGKKAIETGKEAAVSAGKKLIETGVNKLLTPKSSEIINKYSDAAEVSKKAQEVVNKYINEGANNLNKLIDGSGNQRAIAIQDLARRLNGGGLKAVF